MPETQEKHTEQIWNQSRETTAQSVGYLVRQTAPSLLQQTLQAVWAKQLEDDDLELLDVGLYHLFHNLNLLLQEILPQLAEIAVQAEAAQPAQSMRSRQILRHQLWVWLSEMKHRLERIEPLCQIGTITLTHLLTTLDTNKHATLQKSQQQQLFARARQSEQWAHTPLTEEELAYYVEGLQIWQERNGQRQKIQAFRELFSDLPDSHIQLAELDSAIIRIYQSAQIVFTTILSANKTALKPRAAILLLLDIQQHIDNLQIQIETALTPLRALLKHYALLVELC